MSSLETLSYWFIFQNDYLLVVKNGQSQLPTATLLGPLTSSLLRQHTIGIFNNIVCHCAELPTDITLDPPFELISLRKAFELFGVDWYAAAVKAKSIITWDKNHRFCGRCGQPTEHRPGSFERVCPHCQLTFYPRISPCIIVLIKKGDQLLMARSPHFSAGAYGLIAGFVEVGESLEDAVHREVREEVGITIKNVQYFNSQPWPFPDSLMVGFFADYDQGEIHIDHQEIESAGWYRYDQMPGGPSSNVSIARKLIDYFVQLSSAK